VTTNRCHVELFAWLRLPAEVPSSASDEARGCCKKYQPSSEEAQHGIAHVGIDLHRRWSVVVVLNEDGNRVSWSRIDNTPANSAGEIVAAGGPAAEVAMEATWGWWYWAADLIAECGATLHLAHPLGIAVSMIRARYRSPRHGIKMPNGNRPDRRDRARWVSRCFSSSALFSSPCVGAYRRRAR
jgi:hypothetical protein